MSDSGKNTRNLKDRREAFLIKWLAEIKADQRWKEYIWDGGGLKLLRAREEMGKRDPECKIDQWGEDYFSSGHWSHKYRIDFEDWARNKMSSKVEPDMFGQRHKGAPDLPTWLPDENLSFKVMELILEYYNGRVDAEQKVAELQRDLKRFEQQVFRLEAQLKILTNPAGRNAVEEHYMNSVRTLRYNAGIDIDLSVEDLLGEWEKT